MDDQMLLRGGGPQPDDQQQALLAAQQNQQPNQQTMMVRGYMAVSGDHYVDDTGNPLSGAPDANGMMAMPVNADGTYAGSQFKNLGPPYSDSPTPFTGTPMAPGAALDYSASGTGMPSNWQSFETDHNTGTGAGFFTMDGFYGGQGKDVPHQFQSGSSLPSTNNWRLLPPEYRKPNYIMRNGFIIDLNSPNLHGPTGPEGAPQSWRSGADMGFPSAQPIGAQAFNAAAVGWPGSISGWTGLGPATTS